jgi:hypothetical protein
MFFDSLKRTKHYRSHHPYKRITEIMSKRPPPFYENDKSLFSSVYFRFSGTLNATATINTNFYFSKRQIGLSCTIFKLTLGPTSSRMLFISYLTIVGRSSDKPQAITLTFSGRPMGRNISGRKIPEFPISIHFCRPGWKQKISMLGSVYGL